MGTESHIDKAFSACDAVGGDLNRLSVPAKTIVIVTSAQGIIDHGGLEYFFESDFPENPPYSEFSSAYRLIGAAQAADCIDKAAETSPFPHPETRQELRREFLEALPDGSELNRLSNKICGDAEVWERLAAYGSVHFSEICIA